MDQAGLSICSYLGEERSVELEVFLFDVVEAIVAVENEHYDKGGELEQGACVDDNAHDGEDQHLDIEADAFRQHDEGGVECRHAERWRQTMVEDRLHPVAIDIIDDSRRDRYAAALTTHFGAVSGDNNKRSPRFAVDYERLCKFWTIKTAM